MKTIGLIGGMSWQSSAEYYRIINEAAGRKLGGLHSAKIILYSIDFEQLEDLQHKGRWQDATEVIIDAARSLERAGADFIVICSVTGHQSADTIAQAISVPLLNVADAVAKAALSQDIKTLGLLGTKFTMEMDYFRKRLNAYALNTLIPEIEERNLIHRVIYDELCNGRIEKVSKEAFIRIIGTLIENGSQGIVLGCTEICLLINSSDSPVPIFDSTKLHAEGAVLEAMN